MRNMTLWKLPSLVNALLLNPDNMQLALADALMLMPGQTPQNLKADYLRFRRSFQKHTSHNQMTLLMSSSSRRTLICRTHSTRPTTRASRNLSLRKPH